MKLTSEFPKGWPPPGVRLATGHVVGSAHLTVPVSHSSVTVPAASVRVNFTEAVPDALDLLSLPSSVYSAASFAPPPRSSAYGNVSPNAPPLIRKSDTRSPTDVVPEGVHRACQ